MIKKSFINDDWNITPLKDATMYIIAEHDQEGKLIKQEIFNFTESTESGKEEESGKMEASMNTLKINNMKLQVSR